MDGSIAVVVAVEEAVVTDINDETDINDSQLQTEDKTPQDLLNDFSALWLLS